MFLTNYYYILLNYTLSLSLALSACVLFITFIQIINGGQFLNISFSLALFALASAAAVFETVIVTLTAIYASL